MIELCSLDTIAPAKLQLTAKDEARFLSKIAKSGPDDCWLWRGSRMKRFGYGYIGIARKSKLAHRVSFELHNRLLGDGECALHKCDNPPCVNPAHLFAGSRADNTADMIAKGRDKKVRGDAHYARRHPETRQGERNGRAKLTDSEVLSIRARCAAKEIGPKQLAREIGVTDVLIYLILNRRIWKHI